MLDLRDTLTHLGAPIGIGGVAKQPTHTFKDTITKPSKIHNLFIQ
jgi:hypothetical protein